MEIAVLRLTGIDMRAGYKCMGLGGFQVLPGAMADLMRWKWAERCARKAERAPAI